MRLALIALLIITGVVSAPSAVHAQADSQNEFLTAAYRDLLGREADAAGRQYWLELLGDGLPHGVVAEAIGDAGEQRRLVVTQAYQRVLKRKPDPDGLAFWATDIIDRTAEADLYSLFFGSEEYFNRNGRTNDGYLRGLYRDVLTRTPDSAGLGFWSGLLDTGTRRDAIAHEFLSSAEAILQPNLSITDSDPEAGSVAHDLRRITIDLDSEIDASKSAVIVSAGGQRIAGVTTAGLNAKQLVFSADSFPPTLRVGVPVHVVVTVFAYTGADFGRTDFTFTLDPSATSSLDELIVAFYGHAKTGVLGVLGEGTPDEALARLQEQAAPYRVDTRPDTRPVVPAFELIATLVTAAPGGDGLYRSRTEHSLIQPYLDTIRAANGYLILDLQPGRADLEDEARFYEPILLNPEVGLALDPEWKVGPNETPKGRIGALEASEINRVSAYLSELVIANDLPNKILIVHIFKPEMIRNPELIATRPGVTIIFQADGEGGPAAKVADYDNLIPARFGRGFKVFYDEDTPTLKPNEVLDILNPDPDYLSYQ